MDEYHSYEYDIFLFTNKQTTTQMLYSVRNNA